ncbi:relaxase/mobilization nuclease domain-containing protein [Desertibaculum subflavum]|uniref:relaxase/mobilization nuclease domain-containing protein n=1 Tax=Desertibaculum subflavum TaxID=2268458 RepID=UPI000E65ECE3
MAGLSRDDLASEKRGRIVGDDEYRAAIKRRAREILSLGPSAGARLRGGGPTGTAATSTESVLKVIAWTKGKYAAPRQAFYVGRARDKDDPRRQVALENERGELVQGKAAIQAGIASWDLLPDAQNRSAEWRKAAPTERAEMTQADALARRQAVHLMFSVPRGAPSQAEALRDAVREAMRESFGETGYRYLFAIHTDEPRRPHAHIIVKATSEPIAGGRSRQLRLGPRELGVIRARFTEHARERGFDVTCTRRVDRAETRGRILAGKEPLRLNTRPGKLHRQSRQGSIFEAKAPTWYLQHGLGYEQRRLQEHEGEPKAATGAAGPPGLFQRLATAVRGILRRPKTPNPAKPVEQPSSPGLQRLDRHFAETHRSPEAARESFLQMYRESPRLAVWAANNHPQAFGNPTGVSPTGRVTGRGLREVLDQQQPAATPDPRQAAIIAYDTMRVRREADHALQQEGARRDIAAVPHALMRVADRLEGQERPHEHVAELRKLAAATQDPEQMAKAGQYRALDARIRQNRRGRDRDGAFER